MRNFILFFMSLALMAGNANATVGWVLNSPKTSENPQAISPDIIQNNTALDLMLQNYRDGKVTITLLSTSEIDIGAGGVMLSNTGGSVRLMVANTSVSVLNPTMIDIGSISASSTYYIYAYASSVNATTFSVIYSASATYPTGITYYQQLGSFTTDVSSNFVSAKSNINPQIGFGTWKGSYSSGNIYQASTDGFVVAYQASDPGSGSSNVLMGYTDGNSNPTTLRQGQSPGDSYGRCTMFTMPVRKGDYWKVTGAGVTIYWLSIGS